MMREKIAIETPSFLTTSNLSPSLFALTLKEAEISRKEKKKTAKIILVVNSLNHSYNVYSDL